MHIRSLSTLDPEAPASSLEAIPSPASAVFQRLRQRLHCEWHGSLPHVLLDRALSEAAHAAEEAGFAELWLPELAHEYVRRLAPFARGGGRTGCYEVDLSGAA